MFSDRLKSLTKPFHDELEHHRINQKLFNKNGSIEDYCEFLQIQHFIVSSLEHQIESYYAPLLELGITYDYRAPLAEQELKLLNFPSCEEKNKNFHIDDFSSVLAAVYLLEGSRHGAMVLLKMLKPILPEAHPFLFLQSNPHEFMIRWKAIIDSLERYASTKELENQLILDVCRLYTEMRLAYDNHRTTRNV